MSKIIDKIFFFIKWPVAIIAFLLIPGALYGFKEIALGFYHNYHALIPFLAGFGIYYAAWYFLLKSPTLGSMFSTLEHEMTHSLFALLTAHKVSGLRTSWNKGGEMKFSGQGNWLIFISPYFFPTISFIMMLLMGFFLSRGKITVAIYGATIAYHITSTWRETHFGQTDLQKTGYLFSFLFLPAANFISYGILFAFILGGFSASGDYLQTVLSTTLKIPGLL